MQSTLAIARRELRSFFNSPIAYIVLGAFLLFTGFAFFFIANPFVSRFASLRPFFSVAPLLFMFFMPAIAMRLIAEERKSGTLETLLTMPVHGWQVVVGKFLASLGMVSVGIAFTVPYAITMSALTADGASLDWGPIVGGYAGLLLLASSFLALGLLASALSKNQVVGFVVGLLLCFAFWVVDKLAYIGVPDALAATLAFLSVDYHFGNIARGVFDSRDIVYYLSLTGAGLLLSTRALSAVRA